MYSNAVIGGLLQQLGISKSDVYYTIVIQDWYVGVDLSLGKMTSSGLVTALSCKPLLGIKSNSMEQYRLLSVNAIILPVLKD